MKNIIKITIPEEIFYLGNYPELQTQLPKGSYVFNKVMTGCGATTMFLEDSVPTVLCSPRKELIRCKANSDRFAGKVYLFGAGRGPAAKVIDKINDMKSYVQSLVLPPFNQFAPQVPKILVTYDSTKYVLQGLSEMGCLGNFRFVIDEFQTLWTDAAYRGSVVAELMENVRNLPFVVYLSATPYMEKYLDYMDEFKYLPYVELEWPESSTHITSIAYRRYHKGSPSKTIDQIIGKFRKYGYFEELMDGNNQLHYSTEAVIFVNDVRFIIKTIRRNNLSPNEVNIICGDSEDNMKRLNAENLSVGHAPKEGYPHATFTFATKASYEGTDFFSPCAYTYIFSNISNENISNMAVDISLDLPQIMGRQRLSSNFFRHNATFFYKTRPEFTEDQWKTYFDKIRAKSEDTNAVINDFDNRQDETLRRVNIRKYMYSQKLENYENDYISVVLDRQTGQWKLVFNKYVMMNETRAWEVQSDQYTKGNRVMGSAQAAFYTNGISDLVSSFICDFKGSFEEKMRKYATFLDAHPECRELLQMQVQVPTSIKQYYNNLGTARLRALSWKETSIVVAELPVNANVDISSVVRQSFVVGRWYSLKDIKAMLQSVYDMHTPGKTAKATDIEKYFQCTPKKYAVGPGKRENGYMITG